MSAPARANDVITRAMILAAGRGERMRPLTDDCPKPLLRVGGKSLIEYHLAMLVAAGIDKAVINLAWQGDKLRAALGTGERYGIEINYSDEGAKALETGGGIFKALPWLLPGPFLVINGDIWTDWRLHSDLQLAADDVAHLVLVPNSPHHPQGDFALAGTRVIERDESRLTYSGIGIYREEFFAGCTPGAFPMLPLLQRAIRAGRVSGELHAGRWHDIGTPERLATLDLELEAQSRVSP